MKLLNSHSLKEESRPVYVAEQRVDEAFAVTPLVWQNRDYCSFRPRLWNIKNILTII